MLLSATATADSLATAAQLRSRGEPFVMATVVRAVSPTSAKPGDKAILNETGLLVGWIGGSCAEPLVRKAARTALADGKSRLLVITPNAAAVEGDDGAGRSIHRMTCYSGGELEIYVEPFLALPRLLVFGNSPVARAICDLGAVMRYAVTAIDLGDRPQMGDDIETVRRLELLPRVDAASTFAIVSSHGVFDQESLEAALALGLPYTGFVTSKKRREQVFAALRARGVSDAALARVHAPAGIDLGAQQSEEIALSVMAEIVATRRRGAAAERGRELAAVAPAQLEAQRLDEPAREIEASDGPKAHACCHAK